MQPKPQSEKERQVRDWLSKAARDIAAARNDLIPADPFTESAVFHAQQAAERAAKGFLTWHDKTFRKTHEIRELAAQMIQISPDLEDILRKAGDLTPYATVFRYPGETAHPSVEESRNVIQIAEDLLAAIRARLPFPDLT